MWGTVFLSGWESQSQFIHESTLPQFYAILPWFMIIRAPVPAFAKAVPQFSDKRWQLGCVNSPYGPKESGCGIKQPSFQILSEICTTLSQSPFEEKAVELVRILESALHCVYAVLFDPFSSLSLFSFWFCRLRIHSFIVLNPADHSRRQTSSY